MDIRILFLSAETCPAYHADVNTLFGKCLPCYGINNDIVAEKILIHVGEVAWRPSC